MCGASHSPGTEGITDPSPMIRRLREHWARLRGVTWEYTTGEGLAACGAEAIFERVEETAETCIQPYQRTKPAGCTRETTYMSAGKPIWTARWYFWDGGFVMMGRGPEDTIVPVHSHHAIQIAIGLDRFLGLRGVDGDWKVSKGLIVTADQLHEFRP